MRLFLFIFLLVPHISSAQEVFDEKVSQIISTDSLPSSLRSGKSLVLMEIPGDSRKEWDRIKRIVHSDLIKSGIDPVAYYPIELIFSGIEVSKSFINDLTKREINSIILVKSEGNNCTLAITSFTPEFFIGNQQAGWKREGVLRDLLNQLYIRTSNSRLELSNFLISETPEDGLLTSPIKGRRAEFFSLAAKGTKLAVPSFQKPLQDQELRAILDGEYPYDYELIQPDFEEDDLKKQGFQFVLYFAHAEAKIVRDLLGYETPEDVTVFATIHHEKDKEEVRTIPPNKIVYKYYLKHLVSGTTYLGTEWDVSDTWNQAMLNHIRSFKKGVGIN